MDEQMHNWDERREQLSALLDGALPAAERAQLEAHLAGCAACRAELESLRRMSALLRALPQPALPRSFALPLEPSTQQSADDRAQHVPTEAARRDAAAPQGTPPAPRAPTPITSARSTNRRRPVQVLRWLSTVAAVAGLLLLCSGIFTQLNLGARTTSTAANAPSSYQDSGGSKPAPTTPPTLGTPKVTNPQDTPGAITATPTPVPQATGVGVSPGPNPSENSAPTPGGGLQITAAGLGVLLLVVGLCGLIIAAILRRRWAEA